MYGMKLHQLHISSDTKPSVFLAEEGVSHFECMDTYCGAYGASEKETVAIQTEMDRLFASDDVQMVAWVVLHGFGNMWMYPSAHTVDNKGDTCDPAEHEDYMVCLLAYL